MAGGRRDQSRANGSPPSGEVTSVRIRVEDRAELERRAAAASLSLGAYLVEAGCGRVAIPPPTAEVIRRTRVLREQLDAVDNAIADAQDELGAIEEVLGLVRWDGARIDDPPPAAARRPKGGR